MNDRVRARVLTQLSVTISGHSHVGYGDTKATCFDINEEGMYIQTEAEFKSGDILNLEFVLDSRKMKLKASVRHIEPEFGFGVKFINLSPEDKISLKRFLGEQGAGEVNLKIALLIDSSSQPLTVYRHRLTQDGFSVIVALNGNEAVKALQLTKPHIVIIDMQTEGISVYKILQFMQSREELKSVPALILTNRFVPEEAEKLIALCCRDYLVKATTSPNIFSERVKKILKK
jgi:CheY-like chemotaxis protein